VRIEVNGEPMEVGEGARVADVVEQTTGHRAPEGVAVARNGEIVRRSEWNAVVVHETDRFEVVRATAGG
jgi:sulfur carrier protein